MNNVVYFLENKTYINITNSCTNACKFCIRDVKDDVKGACLWLDSDNIKAQDVISELIKYRDKIKNEIIFCGYGEPLLRLDEVKKVREYIRENFPKIKIRINTNGHASLVFKRNVPNELKNLIDEISISLNGENEVVYNDISQPKIEGAYEGMLHFARDCVKVGIPTVMSVVVGYKNYKIDTEKCRKIAEEIGAKFRIREWVEGY